MASPQEFREFRKNKDIGDESGMVAQFYHLLLAVGLAEAIFERVMNLPGSDLSSIATDLDRLWQAALYDRDTSMLKSQRDLEQDEALVAQLERLQDQAGGMIAVLEAYAAADAPPGDDINALIRQASLLAESNLYEARRLFGQAGAAALRGAHVWPLWRTASSGPPVSNWLSGLATLHEMRKDHGEYPLPPIAEQRRRFAARPAPAPIPEPDEADEPDEPQLTPAQQELMNILLCGAEELSADQTASVSFSDPDIVEQLISVLADLEYHSEDSEGGGYAPIHASRLLGRSQLPQAVYPLLETLYDADFDEIIYSAAIFALKKLGPLSLPAVLESMEYTGDYDFKMGLADVLGTVGQGDERAFRLLEAYFHSTTWDDDKVFAVGVLAEHRDPRAVPLLRRALADRDITPMGVREIAFALSELDPNHDPVELKRLEAKAIQRYESRIIRFDKHGRAFCRDCGASMRQLPNGEWMHNEPSAPETAALPITLPAYSGVGRNDLCPCGSGKKFKHCHGSGKMAVN